ncbi:MAG: hypothetical protein ABIR29_13170 [Chthoniobacterales bacterium]
MKKKKLPFHPVPWEHSKRTIRLTTQICAGVGKGFCGPFHWKLFSGFTDESNPEEQLQRVRA